MMIVILRVRIFARPKDPIVELAEKCNIKYNNRLKFDFITYLNNKIPASSRYRVFQREFPMSYFF